MTARRFRGAGALGALAILALAAQVAGARGPWERSDSESAQAGDAGPWEDPAPNSVLFSPTPITLPRGAGYVRNHELLFFNVGYSVVDRLDLHAIFVPIPPALADDGWPNGQVGFKLSLLDVEGFPLRVAALGSWMRINRERFDLLGAVAGVNGRWGGINYTLCEARDEEDRQRPYEMIGAEFRVADAPFKLIVEYVGFRHFQTGEREGFYTVGAKGHRRRFSFAFGYMFPEAGWNLGYDSRDSGPDRTPLPIVSLSWRW